MDRPHTVSDKSILGSRPASGQGEIHYKDRETSQHHQPSPPRSIRPCRDDLQTVMDAHDREHAGSVTG